MEHAWFWAVLFVLGMALVVFDVVRNRRRPLPPDKRRRSEQQAAVMLAVAMTVGSLFLLLTGFLATIGRDWRTAVVGLGGGLLVAAFAVRYWRRAQRR